MVSPLAVDIIAIEMSYILVSRAVLLVCLAQE